MIKLLAVLFISVCLVTTETSGQAAYHDALALSKLGPTLLDSGQYIFQTGIHVPAAEILKRYTDKTTYGGIQQAFSGNPFIRLPAISLLSSNTVTGAASLLSKAGSLNVTSLADGFAKFLVKRTKEELNAAFFSKFAELISKPEYKDAQLLFPQTHATLVAIGKEVYNYEAYLNGLRESFEADLNSLLPNLKRVIEDGRYAQFFTDHPELKAVCLSSIYVGQQLQHKVHTGQIIEEFPVNAIWTDPKLININGAVKTLQFLSGSIRSKDPSRYWIDSDSIQLLLKDEVALKIYLGLLYQKANDIKFNGTDLRKILKEMYRNAAKNSDFIREVKFYLQEFQRQTEFVIISIKNLKEKERDKLEFSDYYALHNASLDLIEFAASIHKIPGFEFLKPSEEVGKKITAARSGATIALDISRRNYASAIINLYQLYDASITDPSADKVKAFILKYGSFMAAVVQAQNSDEVAQAIEAVALPSGSSRIKRESAFNVSLNSYVGLFTGYEKIKGVDRDGFKFNTYGVTAPIGIAISTSKCSWSTSLFLSIVDIGALTAFRFSNDTTETVPDIELKDIISPGAFLSFGIPKSPLSINIGLQAGPILRQITADINDYKENYTRFSISLCVDIPIVNFYTRSKN